MSWLFLSLSSGSDGPHWGLGLRLMRIRSIIESPGVLHTLYIAYSGIGRNSKKLKISQLSAVNYCLALFNKKNNCLLSGSTIILKMYKLSTDLTFKKTILSKQNLFREFFRDNKAVEVSTLKTALKNVKVELKAV